MITKNQLKVIYDKSSNVFIYETGSSNFLLRNIYVRNMFVLLYLGKFSRLCPYHGWGQNKIYYLNCHENFSQLINLSLDPFCT